MIYCNYVSITGGGDPVYFETAILGGRATDGGLYVPTELSKISMEQLKSWQPLSYTDLAFEILSLFIDRSVISEEELKGLLTKSFEPFFHDEKIQYIDWIQINPSMFKNFFTALLCPSRM